MVTMASSLPVDGVSRRWPALRMGELAHPVPVVAMVLLGLNDHLFKGAGLLPQVVTGKLSDIAGVLFFPLWLTALTNLALWLVCYCSRGIGFPLGLDYQLRRWKLLAACGITAVLLSSIQLSATAAQLYADILTAMGIPSQVTRDPTDILALLLLPIPYRIGARQLAAQRDKTRCRGI